MKLYSVTNAPLFTDGICRPAIALDTYRDSSEELCNKSGMTESRNSLVLAVDGGGTRCRVALGDGHEITSVETGSANVSTDFDGALRELRAAFDALAARAGLDLDALAGIPAFVGLAGVTGPEIAERLRAALPLRRVRIADDRPAALRGALGSQDGGIAHCGTGSFFGVQSGGQMRFSGGWGPALGDEASAQWIGRTALRLTLEAVDGRAEMSALAKDLLERFGAAPGIVRFAGSARPAEFGALAPHVTAAAADGDAMARRIMSAGAAEIARSLPAIGWHAGQSLCLTGGIGPHFAPYLPDDLRANLVQPEAEPLFGALSLARDLAGEPRP